MIADQAVTCTSPIKFMWALLMTGKRPNRIHDTDAADKEHKYESSTTRSSALKEHDSSVNDHVLWTANAFN
jgi:hypothetical protein